MHARPVAKRLGTHPVDAWTCVVLLAVLWVYLSFGGTSLLGELIAVPLILLVPGGLLVMMLPSRPENVYFQFALAVGLSIAVCIAIGLLLNALPSGIDHRSWSYALGMVTLAEAAIVALRRHHTAKTRSNPASIFARIDAKGIILAAITAMAIVGALIGGVAWERSNAEATYRQERFAEVWIVPASGGVTLVGVRSDIRGTNRFQLSVSVADRSIKKYDFTLNWQQTWIDKISNPPGTHGRVLISLFDGSSSRPTEHVWYNPSSGT
jgi:Protein of unknown function (DUF1616)